MQREKSELTFEWVKTAIGNLYTAAALAERFYLHLPTVQELAAANIMPHYRVTGIEEPLFSLDEAKHWASKNLIQHIPGQNLPPPCIVLSPNPDSLVGIAPTVIASIPGLRQFHPEFFCGIYFLCSGEDVVYVGQSTCISSRVAQHSPAKAFDRVFFLRVAPSQLDETERRFIKALKPKLNRTGISELKGEAA